MAGRLRRAFPGQAVPQPERGKVITLGGAFGFRIYFPRRLRISLRLCFDAPDQQQLGFRPGHIE